MEQCVGTGRVHVHEELLQFISLHVSFTKNQTPEIEDIIITIITNITLDKDLDITGESVVLEERNALKNAGITLTNTTNNILQRGDIVNAQGRTQLYGTNVTKDHNSKKY